MEDVPTVQDDAGGRAQPFDEANVAVAVSILVFKRGVLGSAVLVQTGQAALLPRHAAAGVPTSQDFVAGLVHSIDAFILPTDIPEGNLD